eukprot:1187942-Heterocapsa_arctica.AAC.1
MSTRICRCRCKLFDVDTDLSMSMRIVRCRRGFFRVRVSGIVPGSGKPPRPRIFKNIYFYTNI